MNKPLAKISLRFRTPVVSTLVIGIIAALCLWLVPFNVMLICTSAGILVTYALVGVAALVGRINKTTRDAEYRMKLWPIAPIVMTLATAIVIVMNIISDWIPVVVTLVIFASGLLYYVLYLRPG